MWTKLPELRILLLTNIRLPKGSTYLSMEATQMECKRLFVQNFDLELEVSPPFF